MELHNLKKVQRRKGKRLGQGHGSGRGKTGGRGTKGQKARGKIKLSFEGGALPLIKRLPFAKGKGKNRSYQENPMVLNVEKLNVFSAKSIVDSESLVKQGLVSKKEAKRVKILGAGKLTVPLTVKVAVSKTAQSKIEKAGGTISL